jgi:hypothetical protein
MSVENSQPVSFPLRFFRVRGVYRTPEPRGGTRIGVIITTRKLIFHEKLSDVPR